MPFVAHSWSLHRTGRYWDYATPPPGPRTASGCLCRRVWTYPARGMAEAGPGTAADMPPATTVPTATGAGPAPASAAAATASGGGAVGGGAAIPAPGVPQPRKPQVFPGIAANPDRDPKGGGCSGCCCAFGAASLSANVAPATCVLHACRGIGLLLHLSLFTGHGPLLHPCPCRSVVHRAAGDVYEGIPVRPPQHPGPYIRCRWRRSSRCPQCHPCSAALPTLL